MIRARQQSTASPLLRHPEHFTFDPLRLLSPLSPTQCVLKVDLSQPFVLDTG